MLAAMVACLGFYLARFRQDFWARPRMAALLGLLVVLAAGAVRLTIEIQEGVGAPTAWYVLPGVVFGLMAAVLFDCPGGGPHGPRDRGARRHRNQRPGCCHLRPLVGDGPGRIRFVAVIAGLVSQGGPGVLGGGGRHRRGSRMVLPHQRRSRELVGGCPLGRTVGRRWRWACRFLTALLGLAALQFLETAFDITTSLRLLELTDRNHDALVLLQEKAFGSFNHSLMVGTLADAAARAVGADPLLARAAAYYHDLGKTQNPTYFIENQFGAQNPHDDLDPRQSVEMIRRHVTDGIELARKYKIPTQVAEGIVTHHGDGIMRYFYEKARQASGDEEVDPNDFRHIGHKPRTAEMAIVMLADSLEAACRAVFRDEEPTAEAIDKVVNRVVDEKVNDGQLSESALTLAQLTKARRAFLEALVGHYHQRIAYPNFPGS